jgi:hypothetical protein
MEEDVLDYRDIENFNLFQGISNHPWIGRGYGFPFERHMDLPDIFSFAEILSWVPHNSALMTWLFGGPQNMATLATLFALSIATYVRLFRLSDALPERLFALIGMMIMIQWLIYVWSDMAWSFVTTVSFPAAFLGIAARLLAGTHQNTIKVDPMVS